MTPSVFFIPAGVPFLEGLAAGLLQDYALDPLGLAQVNIYLPYKRAIQVLKEIFLKKAAGKSLFLPQMFSLGELDPDEEPLDNTFPALPVISPLLRQGFLTTLIRQKQEIIAAQEGRRPPPLAVTLQLAQELIRLLDQAAIEQVPLENLASLVPDHFATHWQVSLDFLQIISHHWPLLLAEKGVQDPYIAHNQGVQQRLTQWAQQPPPHRIIAAGSTGSMPATAAFLKAVAHLPQGSVILPGLDPTLYVENQKNLSASHPQYTLSRLLTHLGLTPQAVPVWSLLPSSPEQTQRTAQARRTWFSQAYAASSTPSRLVAEEALNGLTFIPCASSQEEALVIALILREALETPGKTAALITPDRALARRVREELNRWGVVPQDTAGLSLEKTPASVMLRLIVRAVLEDFAPLALLALLKHPLLLGGRYPALRQGGVSLLERGALRGLTPEPGLSPLAAAFPQDHPQRSFFLQGLAFLETTLAPLKTLLEAPHARFQDLLQAHLQGAQTLCLDALWTGEGGEATDRFFQQLQEGAAAFPLLRGADYPDMLDHLLRSVLMPLETATHPRLSLLGTLEGRLMHADVVILGGLNEGVWPPQFQGDPWLSRPMREDLGLPALERRVGLSSHDFYQAFAQKTVFLTRALRVDGTPTVPSRIFMRLETALKAAEKTMPQDPKWLHWAKELDLPSAFVPCLPPKPCPPLSARPRRLSVTQVETWKRDPYALYARHVLKLTPLNALEAEPNQADHGTLIHHILDQFLRHCPNLFAPEALPQLLELGEKAFQLFQRRPMVRAFWWPRFTQLAEWFLETERDRRLSLPAYKTLTEIRGTLQFQSAYGPFELTARADRLDVFNDGRVDLIDYKTGTLPTEADVTLGFSPQLPLEALIIQQGGFSEVTTNAALGEMSFWRLYGKQGEIKILKASSSTLAQDAWEGLQRFVNAFDHPDMPYLAQPFPDKSLTYNDYAHLARVLAWR